METAAVVTPPPAAKLTAGRTAPGSRGTPGHVESAAADRAVRTAGFGRSLWPQNDPKARTVRGLGHPQPPRYLSPPAARRLLTESREKSHEERVVAAGKARHGQSRRSRGILPMVLVGYAAPQAPPPGQVPDRDLSESRWTFALVVLHATVTDRQGAWSPIWASRISQVYENGVPQHIQLFKNEDIPVAVGLVIDHSSSMRPKIAEVTAAARAFVRSSNREDQMFVVNFNEVASLGCPPLSGSPIAPPNSNAPSGPRQPEARRLFMTPSPRGWSNYERSRDKKVLIVVSDGGDNASQRSLIKS